MDLAQMLKVMQLIQSNPELMRIATVFLGKILGSPSPQAAPTGQGGPAGQLNLQDLLQVLVRSGLQNQVNSWLGTGANHPVSGQQLSAAFSSNPLLQQTLGEAAQQAGVSQDRAADALAGVLPMLVDVVTPNGQVPDLQALQQIARLFQPA